MALLVILTAATLIVVQLERTRRAVLSLRESVDELRLKSRARVATATMRGTATDELRSLVRLGRASRGKRRVVGGDENAELNRRLSERES